MYFDTTACWNKNINCRPTISQVVKDLNDIKMNEFNEFSIVNASQEHINLNQPLVSYNSAIDKNDLDIEKNEQKVFEWFLKSAQSENIDSQYEVAICFRDGKGTKKKY